jgi:NitT/TauT family transport system substrate-binding protein
VILPLADYGLRLYGDAIIVNTKFASENPEAVKGFLRAYLRGLKTTIGDPARAVDSVVKRNEALKKDVELERLRIAIRDTIVTQEVRANGLGDIDAARFADAIEQLGQSYKFKAKPEPADIFDRSFLPAEAERKVNSRPRPG